MQLAGLVGGLSLFVAGTALAAQGDALLVTGNNVNVRAGPSTGAGVLTRAIIDERAIERRRQGEWVEVELPRQDVLGWIHGSLLSPAPVQGEPEPDQDAGGQDAGGQGAGDIEAIAVATTDAAADGTPLGRFGQEVRYFNDRALSAAGVDLFTGVAAIGERDVQVVTTEAWATMSAPGQQNYLNALYARWQAAVGGAAPVRLEIVDESGALMMEKAAP